jgi:FkbM family methyltransferase
MIPDYEPYIQDIINKNIEKNPEAVIIDVGAHIGRHAIGITYQNINTQVHAFEPHPETFRQLKINTLLSGVEDRVICYNF